MVKKQRRHATAYRPIAYHCKGIAASNLCLWRQTQPSPVPRKTPRIENGTRTDFRNRGCQVDFKRIFNSFSRRQIIPDKEVKPLTPEFRNRVLMLCARKYPIESPFGEPPPFWPEMHQELTYLYGRPSLSNGHISSAAADTIAFLEKCSDEFFLDFVESIFPIQHPLSIPAREMVSHDEINQFFEADDLSFRLTSPVYKLTQYERGKEANS